MPIQSKEVVINDSTYTITQFGTIKGLQYMQRLIKLFGPSIAEIFSNIDEQSAVEEMEIEDVAITKATQLFVENLDKEDLANLIQEMTSTVLVDGKQTNFNNDFAGDYGTLMKIVGAVLRENYSSFFGPSGLSEVLKLVNPNRG